MKQKVIIIFLLVTFSLFAFPKPSSNPEPSYHEKFQNAFLQVINSADNNFKDVYYKDRFIKESDDMHELKVDFPEAFDHTFYRTDYKYRGEDKPQTIYYIQIDYNTIDENSAMAQYGIEENDEAKMKSFYNKLVTELIWIQNENIGNRNWQILDDGPYAFTMESNVDEYSKIVVGVDVGTLLGVKLKIMKIMN